MPTQHPSPVIVFDGRPEPVAADNPMPAYGLPLTVTTGRSGSQGVPGEPGDQNVVVLPYGQTEPDPDTPDGTVVYLLLEDPNG